MGLCGFNRRRRIMAEEAAAKEAAEKEAAAKEASKKSRSRKPGKIAESEPEPEEE